MRAIRQLGKLALVTIVGISAVSCGKRMDGSDPTRDSSNPAKDDPSLSLSFFKGSGSGAVFIDPAQLEATLAVLDTAEPGRVASLSYKRSEITADSEWEKIAKIRAPSYAAALQMLSEHQITTPLLVSVSLIDGYLKRQNDAWYAALELALDQRLPDSQLSVGRGKISELLLQDMQSAGIRALTLSQLLNQHRDTVNADRAKLEGLWQADPFQFKPISFYSDDDRLQRIWTSDRYLLAFHQSIARSELDAFNSWWQSSSGQGKAALSSMRAIFSKVTNQIDPALFDDSGFGELINPLRRNASECDGACGHIWAPSSQGVLERLPPGARDAYDKYGDPSPPMDVIVDAIKSGKLSLRPGEKDGFFIHQRYALEPLLNRNGLSENEILKLDEKMQDVWTEVYKSGSAKALETHQKVIDTGGGIESAEELPSFDPEQLLLEPLPTAYKRWAQGYSFMLAYVRTLPAEFVQKWLVDDQPITAFLEKLEAQMYALYLVSSKQLGLLPDDDVKARLSELGEASLLKVAREFLSNLGQEPAMTSDQRFMAVMRRPGGPKNSSCFDVPATFWTTLGIEAVPVEVRASGALQLAAEQMVILVDHFAEIKACVDEPLTRQEWRQLLDASSNLKEARDKLVRDY